MTMRVTCNGVSVRVLAVSPDHAALVFARELLGALYVTRIDCGRFVACDEYGVSQGVIEVW